MILAVHAPKKPIPAMYGLNFEANGFFGRRRETVVFSYRGGEGGEKWGGGRRSYFPTKFQVFGRISQPRAAILFRVIIPLLIIPLLFRY